MKEITINIFVIVRFHASFFRGIFIGFLFNHSVRVPSHRSCRRFCYHCSCIRALFDKQRFTNSHSIFLISLFILCFANTFTFLKDFSKTRFSFSLIAINNVLLFSFVLHLSLLSKKKILWLRVIKILYKRYHNYFDMNFISLILRSSCKPASYGFV